MLGFQYLVRYAMARINQSMSGLQWGIRKVAVLKDDAEHTTCRVWDVLEK
jgi:hypothetical protein